MRSRKSQLQKVKIEDEVTDVVCEECGRNMVVKYGPHGKFLACPGFPGLPQYQAVSGKDRCGMSEVWQRHRYEKVQKGKKILRM